MRLWLIPTIYAAGSIIGGLVLPRIEHAYLPGYIHGMSASAAVALLSTVASGMMALTAIVFSIAFVMVQFSAIAYSPRLVLWFARDRVLFHSLGIFTATFIYSLAALGWIDRGESVGVPLFSMMLVALLLILSMILFAQLVQRLSDLQITNVLHLVGDKGREVIRMTLERLDDVDGLAAKTGRASPERNQLGPVTQTLRYFGGPRTIAKFDVEALMSMAREAGGVIVMACAVGDTLVDDTALLDLHGGKKGISEDRLRRAIHLARERTFEQDPKYPIRLLVDIAIKALSPAINDPTTAVQAVDQIEDLLRRVGRHELDTGYAHDSNGAIRVILRMPTWDDFLALAFDEIRQYGAGSVQVMRRLRSALVGIAESVASETRTAAVRHYLSHLDQVIEHSTLDAADRMTALQEDRQGLGLTGSRARPKQRG